jgi:CheY-like chemotaxis protein
VKTKLRILLVEDSHADADLIALELSAAGFDFDLARIESEAELRREMETDKPDLILSDHGLPSFDGFTALAIVRQMNPELPFIFVSGSNNQAMVARMFEEGATDYVFKNDLHDLSPAMHEALTPPSSPYPSPVVEAPQARPPTITDVLTRLWFCPSCLHTRDEQGVTVESLEYFRNHNQVVVVHELCDPCRAGKRFG